MQNIAERETAVEEKLDELIALLDSYEFDSLTVKKVQQRLNNSVESKAANRKKIDAFKGIDKKLDSSREELLDEFSTLLLSNKFDSSIADSYIKGKRINKIVLMLVGIIMITLGFAMIIMPAPPYFEMFTIFYFSKDNGVTLMDLISLAIIFSGIYIFVRSLYKKK